jgi:ubiquinone/menaquinone biosynthesis C-methylase UbiE
MSVTSRLATFAGTSKLVAKHYYPRITRAASDDLLFINMGYEEDPPMSLPLDEADERYRYSIQLYHTVATQVPLKGKQVLEVSCGHGGGASYLTRTLQPASYTGLDLNQPGIEFCRKHHQLPGLGFVHGNAEHLPFDAESFDAVISIEASSYYELPRFLAEAERVLRPGGYLLYADVRYGHGQIAAWEKELAGCPLQLVSQRVISDEVARGAEHNATAQWLGKLIRDKLRSGEFSWRMYCYVKAARLHSQSRG